MAGENAGVDYSIVLTRKGADWIASIAELCVARRAASPQEALSAALQAQGEVRESLQGAGLPLPPSGDRIDPLPAASQAAGRFFAFFKQVLLGYLIVACLTAFLIALAMPSVRSRAEQYLNSKELSTNVGKLLARLGIAVCAGGR